MTPILTIMYMLMSQFLFIINANGCLPKSMYSGASAIAVMNGNLNGSTITGTITFMQPTFADPLNITINITGLPTGQGNLYHGLHVHAYGIRSTSSILSDICGSVGLHFNPLNMTHGDISSKIRHVGDYGNVVSDNNGKILTTFIDTISSLYGPFGVIGRTIVLHQLQDDLGLGNFTDSKTTGHSGTRIACGMIGFSNS